MATSDPYVVGAQLTEFTLLCRVVGWRRRVLPGESDQTARLERAGLLVVSADAAGVMWASATRAGMALVEGETAAERTRIAVEKGRAGQAALQARRRFEDEGAKHGKPRKRSDRRADAD